MLPEGVMAAVDESTLSPTAANIAEQDGTTATPKVGIGVAGRSWSEEKPGRREGGGEGGKEGREGRRERREGEREHLKERQKGALFPHIPL